MGLPDHPLVNCLRYTLEYLGLGNTLAPFPIRRESKPWRLDELPAAPEGYEIHPPDFVGVGTQKGGTSWWMDLIEQHPAVSKNLYQRKEMHYLSHFLENSFGTDEIQTYHAVFARPAGQICGEWTPNYVACPHAIVRLKQAAPDAKIMVMLRDPIARYESGFNHETKQRFGGIIGPKVRMNVVKRFAMRSEAVWYGMYGSQMEILLSQFPKEQIHVIQYEKCRTNPEEQIQRTYSFLGIDSTFEPTGIRTKINRQKRVVDRLSKEARKVLVSLYESDVRKLTELFPDAIDPTLWANE